MPSVLSKSRFAAVALWAGTAAAQTSEESPEYWNPSVVTPTGQASRVSESPSTTFVITADEIRRSGATSLPEILRRVPGLDVRSITATDGQLGLRGFAYEIANRILVLVDGRTAYIDFFGGTTWEMLPVSLVDIERIEVVLGPGASVYGNKAMLGTINIVTRSAADYAFPEARVDAGPAGEGRLGARVAAAPGPWRLRATGVARRLELFEADVRGPSDAGGGTLFVGYSPAPDDEASVELGAIRGDTHMIPTGTRIEHFDGTVGYLRALGRLGLGGPGSPYGTLNADLVWNLGKISSTTFPDASGFRATYHTPYARVHHEIRTRLLGLSMNARWGGEVRLNTLRSTITTGERSLWNVAGFASDEVLLGRWRLTAGLRVDRSTLTDFSFSPRLAAVWSPVERQQIRLSYNTGYNDGQLLDYFADFLTPDNVRVLGNRDLEAEHVRYGELGWAGGLTRWLRAFATAFVYRFDDWVSLDQRAMTLQGGVPAVPYGNNEPFVAYGGETGVDLNVQQTFAAYASYAYVGPTSPPRPYPYNLAPHGSPRHKVSAGVRIDLPAGAYLGVDAQYFGPSEIARVGDCPPSIFCQTELQDFVMAHARVGYTFSGVDLSLAVSNATDDRTLQFPGGERPARRIMATMAYYP